MNDDAMQALLANVQTHPFSKLGELVKGKIIHKTKNKCLVDLFDGQAVGLITGRETHDSSGTYKSLQQGDDVEAVIVEDENEEGFIVLSLRKAAQNTAWDRFERMYHKGEVFEVRIDEANKGGLLLEIDSIKSFLPVSQLAPMHYPRVNEANSQEILRRLQKLIGIKFNVKIIAIDRDNGKLILSERAAQNENRSERLVGLKGGDRVKGKISGIVKFGLFVAFDGLEGLVHISEIAWGHVRNPADYGKLGDEVEVKVIGVEGEKISLSMKQLQDDPWVEAAKKYEIGAKVKGKVNRITSFGAFITLEKDINGLIHLSEISHAKVDEIDKFIKVGQEVEAEVINLDLKEHRIGLSMKKLLPMEETSATTEKPEKDDQDLSSKAKAGNEKEAQEEGKESQEEGLELEGISQKYLDALKSAGFNSLQKIRAASKEDLVAVEGIGEKTAEKIMGAL